MHIYIYCIYIYMYTIYMYIYIYIYIILVYTLYTTHTSYDIHMNILFTLLDVCVSSLRRGHANLLCIVPILTDGPQRESYHIQMSFSCLTNRTDTMNNYHRLAFLSLGATSLWFRSLRLFSVLSVFVEK